MAQPGKRRYAARLPPSQRREQLLDSALALLGQCGLHDLSMEAVAKAAGVGKPVLYTVFRSRAELVRALLDRERERALTELAAALPTDLAISGPAAAYSATISAFVRAVLASPVRWRLILAVPGTAPTEYRDDIRASREVVLAQAQSLARMGIALEPRLIGLDADLLAHTMLTFAEMLGRLAVTDPQTYSLERLTEFANAATTLIAPVADGAS